jgi:cation transport ATPase
VPPFVANVPACGIAAGTPLVILGAIGRAARQGAIVKGGLYLESLATIGTVALDKTGTLTFGKCVSQCLREGARVARRRCGRSIRGRPERLCPSVGGAGPSGFQPASV